MVWITTVPPAEATGTLADAYRRQAATLGHPSDFSLLGSLDPNLVAARMDLYRASERCPSALTQRQRRIVAYLTSVLNRTPHCASQVRLKLTHTGVPDHLIGDLDQGRYEYLAPAEAAVARYAHKLTVDPGAMIEADVQTLREVGLGDLALVPPRWTLPCPTLTPPWCVPLPTRPRRRRAGERSCHAGTTRSVRACCSGCLS